MNKNLKALAAAAALTATGVTGLVAYNPTPVAKTVYASTNWGGKSTATTLRVVDGSWTIYPSAKHSDIVDTWVGDGGVTTGTILQVGVQVQGNDAWPWVEDYPAAPVYLGQIPAHIGDTVHASVSTTGMVRIAVNNVRWHKHFAFNFAGASSEAINEVHNTLGTANGGISPIKSNLPVASDDWNLVA